MLLFETLSIGVVECVLGTHKGTGPPRVYFLNSNNSNIAEIFVCPPKLKNKIKFPSLPNEKEKSSASKYLTGNHIGLT